MLKRETYRAAATTIIVHVLALSIGFNILAVVFEFPDVLRESAAYRLNLFTQNSGIIVPTYYLLALTGFTQIILSILLHQSFSEGKRNLVVMTTAFGVLTGIFQVAGFIRWAIVVPYIAEAMNTGVSMETIAFVEGTLNRYAGMAIGEHLGFLCQATWTTLLGITMIKDKLFDRWLGWAGIGIGLLSFPMSMEPLGGFFNVFGVLTWPVNGAWLIWLIIIAISLLRTNAQTEEGMPITWKTAVVSTLIWSALVIPSFTG